jgi:hypothetical protein
VQAYWYRANWLANVPSTDPGRPNLSPLAVARVEDLVDQLQPASTADSVVINTISSAGVTELILDGVSQGRLAGYGGETLAWTVQVPNQPCPNCSFPVNATVQCRGLQNVVSATTWQACESACCKQCNCRVWQFAEEKGCWIGAFNPSSCYPGPAVTWQGAANPGRGPSGAPFKNITAVGLDASHQPVATHTLLAPGPAARLALYVDSPSPATGTGTSLYAGKHGRVGSLALVQRRR